jgi:hypothetical protein
MATTSGEEGRDVGLEALAIATPQAQNRLRVQGLVPQSVHNAVTAALEQARTPRYTYARYGSYRQLGSIRYQELFFCGVLASVTALSLDKPFQEPFSQCGPPPSFYAYFVTRKPR